MQLGENEKRRLLLRSLQTLAADPHAPVGEEALRDVLEERIHGGQFDENLFEQLITQVRKQGPLTAAAFAEVWLDAERRLWATREGFAERRAQLQGQLDALNRQKLAEEGTERLNARNIMEGSVLTVTVRQIRNISKADARPFEANFILSCEGLLVETGTAPSAPVLQVDKQFQFPIKLGTEPLEVQMVDVARGGKPEGVVRVSLRELRSQEKREISENFASPFGQPLPTAIEMECEWIYSIVKLLDARISAAVRQLAALEQEKEQSERYLHELVAPFPELRRAAPTQAVLEKPFLAPRSPANYLIEEKPWNKLPATGNPSAARFLLYALYVYLLGAVLAHLYGHPLLDVLTALLLFGAVQLNAPLLNRAFAQKGMVAVGVAQLLGVGRIAINSRAWSGPYIDGGRMLTLRRAGTLAEGALLGARLGVLAGLFLSYKSLPAGGDEFEPHTGDFHRELL